MKLNKFFRFINRANSLLFFALTIAICFLLAIAFYADNEKDQIKKPVPVKRVVKKKSAAIPTSVTFHSSKVDGDISIVYVRTRKQGKCSEGIVFYNHTKESFINPFADGTAMAFPLRLKSTKSWVQKRKIYQSVLRWGERTHLISLDPPTREHGQVCRKIRTSTG